MKNIFRKLFDRRTPEQKVTDGIRKQVNEFKVNSRTRFITHSVYPKGNRVMYVNHTNEERTFH